MTIITMRSALIAAVAGLAGLLAACTQAEPVHSASAAPAGPAVRGDTNQDDPYPSTYHPYPGVPTAITGATIYDGEGGRIENGTIVFAEGRIVAVGGPDTPIPAGVTRIECGRVAAVLAELADGTAPSTVARKLGVGYATVARISRDRPRNGRSGV